MSNAPPLTLQPSMKQKQPSTGMASTSSTRTGQASVLNNTNKQCYQTWVQSPRFFKDRHWLFTEFPELRGNIQPDSGAARDEKFTIFEVGRV